MQLQKLFREVRKDSAALAWEGAFKDYLSMVVKDPSLARLAHTRIHDMVNWSGVKENYDGSHTYQLFEDDLFGVEKTIRRLVQIFQSAAQIPEERRRILLLMGPPGSGKSTIVNHLKKGLERYSKTSEGALYAIAGCPMQEDPLHLVPENRRAELEKAYGFSIEGDLCPRCRYSLRNLYKGDISKVKVKRIAFAEAEGVGIGSFVATSPEGQNIDRLVGSIDVASLTEDRLEGAGKGFRLDGELEAANRGIMEFIQIFRSDDKFLTVLLGVSQEQVIKLGSFGSVYADEAIIAHTNEAEYNHFVENKESEALLDRLIMLKVPYTLQLSNEISIYRKLLSTGYKSGAHMSPITLPLVASMAIISRLEDGKRTAGMPKVSLLDKLNMYDGKFLPPWTRSDVLALQDEGDREGMFGLSPRYIINRLANAMGQEQECLRPLDALIALVEGLEERAGLSSEDRERLPNLIPEVIKGYKNMALRQVQQAAFEGFADLAQGQFEAYINDAKNLFGAQEDPIPGHLVNDHLMRRVEGALNMRESERAVFRQEVFRTHESMVRDGRVPTYHDFPLLQEAIDKLLFPNPRELAQSLDPKQTNPDRLQHRKETLGRLQSDHGYCKKCAKDVILVAFRAIQNQDVASMKRGRLVRQ